MEIKDIQNLIKFVAKSGASEVKLEMEDVKITIKTGADNERVEPAAYPPAHTVVHTSAPAAVAAPAAAAPAPAAPVAEVAPATPEPAAEEDKYITIKSPIIGTFYRKPSPDKPMFVEVGDKVSPGSVMCVIEAMKLFNEIESEVSGKIVKVLVDDSSPVEFDQPLFLIDPA
jgi:acetyl-CoA carboxylase biotin carboxyl carrier protein